MNKIIFYIVLIFHSIKIDALDFLIVHSNYNNPKDEEWFYKNYLIPENSSYKTLSLYPINPNYQNPILPFVTCDQSSIAQVCDVNLVLKQLKEINDTIAIGNSLGAATLLNSMTHTQSTQNVRGIVLFNSFANSNDFICKIFYLDFIPLGSLIAKQIANFFFPNYKSNGIQPIFSIKDIRNKDLFIFLIHSQNDSIIDINHSRKLYVEFVKNGFKNVYLLEIKNCEHGKIINTSGMMLKKVIQSFYKKIIKDLDISKESNLNSLAKPEIDEVIQKIKRSSSREYLAKLTKFFIVTYVLYKFYKKYYPLLKKI